MQGYSYSVFSLAAIIIHLIINFHFLAGKGLVTERGWRYRGFLLGVLFYYMADGAWGIFAGLGWTGALHADTILFFLSMPVFLFMWCRFVIAYLDLGRRTSTVLAWSGYALLAFTAVMLAVNAFNGCIFAFDDQGKYLFGDKRYLSFALLVAYNALIAAAISLKAVRSRDADLRRIMMAFLFSITLAVFIVLQIIWPLTPFTALGCLICNCFFHVFVVQDEQAVKHMAELEDALERARAAEKARSMFFSIVSHDIRTPLNAILGYSELLQFGVTNKSERDEALKSIRTNGTTLLQLVNDVLDLAKMDAGKMELRPEPVQLPKLTDLVFTSFQITAVEKGVELVNRTVGVPTVLLDEHRFRQILFNLIGNAVKFTERGSVTVSASYVGTSLEVSVSDTGCGIPPDMLTHILDPFVQVLDPSHAADRTGGTGLGLSICRRLVEAMGGKLLVESELGKGSTFKICIPRVVIYKEAMANYAEPVQEQEPDGAATSLPKHVLVVDDSAVNRSVLTVHLKRAGVTSIKHACDGVEALAEIDSAMKAGKPFDFVFSDLWMPKLNGGEFIEKLRADYRFSKLPVFAVTADTEFSHDTRSNLFTGVLLKPLTYGKLMEAFHRPQA